MESPAPSYDGANLVNLAAELEIRLTGRSPTRGLRPTLAELIPHGRQGADAGAGQSPIGGQNVLVYTAMKSDDALATILLVSRVASDGTSPFNPRQFWRLVEQVGDPGRLLGITEDGLVGGGHGKPGGRLAGAGYRDGLRVGATGPVRDCHAHTVRPRLSAAVAHQPRSQPCEARTAG